MTPPQGGEFPRRFSRKEEHEDGRDNENCGFRKISSRSHLFMNASLAARSLVLVVERISLEVRPRARAVSFMGLAPLV